MTRRHPISFIVLFVLVLAAAAGSATAAGASPSFVDPTATVYGAAKLHLGNEVYVGPFARFLAAGPSRAVHVGDESDIQDSVVVDALRGSVTLRDPAILAHAPAGPSG